MTRNRTLALLRGSAACALIAGLAGCAATDEARRTSELRMKEAEATIRKSEKIAAAAVTSPNVRHHGGIWLGEDGERVSNGEPLPAKWEQPKAIVLNSSKPLTLSEIATRLRDVTGLRINDGDLLLSWGGARGRSGGGGGGAAAAGAAAGGAAAGGGAGAGGAPGGSGAIGSGNTSIRPGDSIPTVPGDVFGEFTVQPSGSPQRDGTPLLPPIPVNYTGPLSGLLNKICAEYGLDWEYKNGAVRFLGVQTKVFTLYAMNLDSTTTSKVDSNVTGGSAGGAGGTTGGGSAGGATSTQGTSTSISNKYWSEVENQLISALPGDTLYSVNKAAGTITVTGRPSAIRYVDAFVREENRRLGRQVVVSVKVLSVKRTSGDQYGINTTAVFNNALSGITAGLTGAPVPFTLTASQIGSMTMGVLSPTTANSQFAKDFSGSSAAIKALSTIGNVTLMTESSVVTLNNQTAPVAVMNKMGYIHDAQTTAATATTGASVSANPSEVNTGFNMNVTPRIFGNNDILLNFSISISKLNALTATTLGDPNGSRVDLQLPDIDMRSFMQNVRLHSGDTLVLAGFQQMGNEFDRNGMGSADFPLLGGGTNATNEKDVIVVVISPVVLETNKPLNVSN